MKILRAKYLPAVGLQFEALGVLGSKTWRKQTLIFFQKNGGLFSSTFWSKCSWGLKSRSDGSQLFYAYERYIFRKMTKYSWLSQYWSIFGVWGISGNVCAREILDFRLSHTFTHSFSQFHKFFTHFSHNQSYYGQIWTNHIIFGV